MGRGLELVHLGIVVLAIVLVITIAAVIGHERTDTRGKNDLDRD
jgi:hypothetical protein